MGSVVVHPVDVASPHLFLGKRPGGSLGSQPDTPSGSPAGSVTVNTSVYFALSQKSDFNFFILFTGLELGVFIIFTINPSV